jgi:hypothetical protein
MGLHDLIALSLLVLNSCTVPFPVSSRTVISLVHDVRVVIKREKMLGTTGVKKVFTDLHSQNKAEMY